mgnify:CR=1 FL=1|tara:strand:- start:820 stop:1122 length:303 start_codon:yes stop_codon:yes gene_type:complete
MRKIKNNRKFFRRLGILVVVAYIAQIVLAQAMSALHSNIFAKAQPAIESLKLKPIPQEDMDGIVQIVDLLSLSISLNVVFIMGLAGLSLLLICVGRTNKG